MAVTHSEQGFYDKNKKFVEHYINKFLADYCAEELTAVKKYLDNK
jgi:hypothetical protein